MRQSREHTQFKEKENSSKALNNMTLFWLTKPLLAFPTDGMCKLNWEFLFSFKKLIFVLFFVVFSPLPATNKVDTGNLAIRNYLIWYKHWKYRNWSWLSFQLLLFYSSCFSNFSERSPKYYAACFRNRLVSTDRNKPTGRLLHH